MRNSPCLTARISFLRAPDPRHGRFSGSFGRSTVAVVTGIALCALFLALLLVVLLDAPHPEGKGPSVDLADQVEVALADSATRLAKTDGYDNQSPPATLSVPAATLPEPKGEAVAWDDNGKVGNAMAGIEPQRGRTSPLSYAAHGFVAQAGPDVTAPAHPDDAREQGLSISGRVLDETGQLLPDIVLTIRPIRLFETGGQDAETAYPSSAQEQSTSTDFDGAYAFWDLADGEYQIKSTGSDGFASVSTTVRAGVSSVDLVLTWQKEVTLSGVVRSTDGTPLEKVQVATSSSSGPYSSSTRVTHTDPLGSYELKAILTNRDETVDVRFKRDGYSPQLVQLDEVDLNRDFADLYLDIYLEPEAGLVTVTGTLKGPNGRSVTGETVQLMSHRLKRSYQGVSDKRGRFSISAVEPGTDYTLWVRPKTRYRDYKKRSLQVRGGRVNFDVVLEPVVTGRLEGQMVDLENYPIPGFSLTVKSRSASHHSVQVTGDDQGFFVVEDIPVGPVVLKTTSFPRFAVVGLQASQEADEPVTVILDLGEHELRGLVVDGAGAPVAAADITLSMSIDLTFSYEGKGPYSVSSRNAVSDELGYFQFTGLGPARYVVRVKAPGFETAELRHDMGAGQNEIVIHLDEM